MRVDYVLYSFTQISHTQIGSISPFLMQPVPIHARLPKNEKGNEKPYPHAHYSTHINGILSRKRSQTIPEHTIIHHPISNRFLYYNSICPFILPSPCSACCCCWPADSYPAAGNPFVLSIAPQSHSKVIGMLHRSCGTKGCWKEPTFNMSLENCWFSIPAALVLALVGGKSMVGPVVGEIMFE